MNMGYNFMDFGQRAETPFPMSIQTVFNGVNLDNSFSNSDTSFITLSTSGRDLVSQTYEETDIFGRQDPYIEDIKISKRVIKVKCLIKARSNSLYRSVMESLNKFIVLRKFAELSFTDDSEWGYEAMLVDVSEDYETTNKRIVELTFYCQSPFKRSKLKTLTTTNAKVMNIETDFPVVPERIELNFSTQPDKVLLHNTTTGSKIIYDRKTTVVKSNKLIINQKEYFIGYINNQNSFVNIDIKNSDFNTFTIDNGDQIVVNPVPTSIVFNYRGAKL